MKEITLKIYTIDELDENAKEKAIEKMREFIYEYESDFLRDCYNHFKKHIKPQYQYSHDELPEEDCYSCAFKEKYQFHGGRLGEYILKAFTEYCEKQWDDFFFDDDECIDNANTNEYMFFADGEFYGSND